MKSKITILNEIKNKIKNLETRASINKVWAEAQDYIKENLESGEIIEVIDSKREKNDYYIVEEYCVKTSNEVIFYIKQANYGLNFEAPPDRIECHIYDQNKKILYKRVDDEKNVNTICKYDENGRIINKIVKDRCNNITTYNYDEMGNETKEFKQAIINRKGIKKYLYDINQKYLIKKIWDEAKQYIKEELNSGDKEKFKSGEIIEVLDYDRNKTDYSIEEDYFVKTTNEDFFYIKQANYGLNFEEPPDRIECHIYDKDKKILYKRVDDEKNVKTIYKYDENGNEVKEQDNPLKK